MNTSELGRLVRLQRKALGMNQSELAMVSETGRRFIGELEGGKETCELGRTLRVLANLGIEVGTKPKRGE